MKKLLNLIGAITLVGAALAPVAACQAAIKTTDQADANAIKDKITDVDLIVPAGINPSTANPQTVTAIKTSVWITLCKHFSKLH